MRIEIKIDTSNAAFGDYDRSSPDYDEETKLAEVRRIADSAIYRVWKGERSGECFDYNGNHVGAWRVFGK